MKKIIFGHIFAVMFQMAGAVICAEAHNYIMVGWCTGWATYSIIQLEKLAKKKREGD